LCGGLREQESLPNTPLSDRLTQTTPSLDILFAWLVGWSVWFGGNKVRNAFTRDSHPIALPFRVATVSSAMRHRSAKHFHTCNDVACIYRLYGWTRFKNKRIAWYVNVD